MDKDSKHLKDSLLMEGNEGQPTSNLTNWDYFNLLTMAKEMAKGNNKISYPTFYFPAESKNHPKGVDDVDLQKYIDRLDQDRRDSEQRLREDRFASERRLNDSMIQLEQRLNDSHERLEKQLTDSDVVQKEERRISEKQFNEKLIEHRNERRIAESLLNDKYREVMEKFEKSIDKSDETIKRIEDKSDETKRWIIGVCLTTIIGIAAMVVTIVLTSS